MKSNDLKPNSSRTLESRLRAETPRFTAAANFTQRVMDALPARIEPRGAQCPVWPWTRLAVGAFGLGAVACLTVFLIQILAKHPATHAVATQTMAIAIEVPEI